jgi:hypothetical protein
LLCFVDHCLSIFLCPLHCQRPSCSWPYGSWIYSYLCNQCLSPLTLWVRIPLMRGVLDTPLCGKVCQWLWFPPPNFFSLHDITEILLKVALNTILLTPTLHCIVFPSDYPLVSSNCSCYIPDSWVLPYISTVWFDIVSWWWEFIPQTLFDKK